MSTIFSYPRNDGAHVIAKFTHSWSSLILFYRRFRSQDSSSFEHSGAGTAGWNKDEWESSQEWLTIALPFTSFAIDTFQSTRFIMMNAEVVTMKHLQFRLKIDLSKFFHDARQFCWIFVDGTKIQQIIHIQHHISKLFSITEPFHLLLNDTEYLPPIEDVRILRENETIQLVQFNFKFVFIYRTIIIIRFNW